MKQVILTTLFFLVFFSLRSQEVDSAIFTSVFEKDIFMDYMKNGEADPLKLLSCQLYTDKIEAYNRTGLNKIINQLNKKKISDRRGKKKIREIYTFIQESHLMKYEDIVYFNDIFSNGTYNCVSSSALFAFVFDEFGIDYTIKETPSHVYIIAESDDDQFLIETASPTDGILSFDEDYKRDYIRYLYQNEFISEVEFRQNTTVNTRFVSFPESSLDYIAICTKSSG